MSVEETQKSVGTLEVLALISLIIPKSSLKRLVLENMKYETAKIFEQQFANAMANTEC